ncbi:MAG: hypothetical protein CMJ96_04525 [Planctomycetes bacterium]|nr:hypothetical protein [Planctomycetota bacterium]
MIFSALLLSLTPAVFFQEPEATELEAAQRKTRVGKPLWTTQKKTTRFTKRKPIGNSTTLSIKKIERL